MSTHALLLRLAGPMQAWGTHSRFEVRQTDADPSKSGVIGLVCAALGRPRDEPVDDLAALHFGVRVNREGLRSRDYQTAGAARDKADPARGIYTASGTVGANLVTTRYYLADADFTAGFSGTDLDLLERIDRALRAPRWPLYLGRKAMPPGLPVALPGSGVRANTTLESALRDEPVALIGRADPPTTFRLVLEEPNPGLAAQLRDDQPVGAAFLNRTFATRGIRTLTVPATNGAVA